MLSAVRICIESHAQDGLHVLTTARGSGLLALAADRGLVGFHGRSNSGLSLDHHDESQKRLANGGHGG